MVVKLASLEGHTEDFHCQLSPSVIFMSEPHELKYTFDDVEVGPSRSKKVLRAKTRRSILLNLFSPATRVVYHWREILLVAVGMAYGVVHYLVDYFIVNLLFGILFMSMQMYVLWWKHTGSLHWWFFSIWIKQMKVVILILASLTIFWTDIYWGISTCNWGTLVATCVTNAIILFILWTDIMDVTLFIRAIIPPVLFLLAGHQIPMNTFWYDDFPMWTFQGHVLSLLDIQNVAWSQILVLSFLYFQSVVMDTKHKKFYFIEENEKRGEYYTTKGWIFDWTDIALLITFIVYVCTFRFEAKIGWQVMSGLLLVFAGIPFISGVKLKYTYIFRYRPALLILATMVILFCDTYRLVLSKIHIKQVEQSIHTAVYVYCLVLAMLSDFHIGPTKMFRLFVAFLMVILTVVSLYYFSFVVPDVRLITIGGRTLGVNSVERNAYFQVLFLLNSQLLSLIEDPSHSKFFLLPKRCQRKELFERYLRESESHIETSDLEIHEHNYNY